MPLEFALRPRFDLNRPPKRRRLAELELPPYALPIAAYWLAMAGGAYALVQSRAPDAANEARHEVMSDSSRISDAVSDAAGSDAVSSDAPARWGARSDLGGAVVPTHRVLEPAPVAPSQDREPRRQAVMDSVPRAKTALDRALASPPEAPRLAARSAAPPPQLTAPLERTREPPPRHDEIPDRETPSLVLGAETPRREAPPTALPSCEAAADAGNQIIDLGASRGAPDLTRGAFAAVLENGTYLSSCAIPVRTALDVCAAVRDGQVVGVTVTTEPRDPAISACVRRAVAALRFPRNSRLDVTHTRFESSR